MEIEILIGISGSGKSTYANEKVTNNPDWVKVNRDLFRYMLFGASQSDESYYKRKDLKRCEDLVSELQEQTIYDALNKGKSVIVDNTHLKKKYVNDLIRKFNHLASMSLNFFDISLEEAQDRVIYRNSPGFNVDYIGSQMNNYLKLKKELHGHQLFYPQINPKISFNQNLPETYAFDLDMSLADNKHRSPFDESKIHLDTEIKFVGDVLRALRISGNQIIFISGRQETCREASENWLKEKRLWSPTAELFMRKAGDVRPDYIIKEEIILNDVVPKYNLIAIVDDRMSVTREYFRLGIPVFNVNQGFVVF